MHTKYILQATRMAATIPLIAPNLPVNERYAIKKPILDLFTAFESYGTDPEGSIAAAKGILQTNYAPAGKEDEVNAVVDAFVTSITNIGEFLRRQEDTIAAYLHTFHEARGSVRRTQA